MLPLGFLVAEVFEMLAMAWLELNELTMRIENLKGRRNAAKRVDDRDFDKMLADTLAKAVRERDRLVAKIAGLIAAGADDEADASLAGRLAA